MKLFAPGVKTPFSGQYKLIGPRGKEYDTEITAIKGKILPPPPKAGIKYEFIDATKNKSGKE